MTERDPLHRKAFGRIYRDSLGPSDVPYEYYHMFHPTPREQAGTVAHTVEDSVRNPRSHKRELAIAASIGAGVITGIIFLSRRPHKVSV